MESFVLPKNVLLFKVFLPFIQIKVYVEIKSSFKLKNQNILYWKYLNNFKWQKSDLIEIHKTASLFSVTFWTESITKYFFFQYQIFHYYQ